MKKTWQKILKNVLFYMANLMMNSIGKTLEKKYMDKSC